MPAATLGSEIVAGTATGIGSLPHLDPHEAAAFSLALSPDLPAAPQLPRRSPREGMLAQAAVGIPGVQVDGDGRLLVHPSGLDPEWIPTPTTLDAEAHAGLLAFLQATRGHVAPVKLQLTGPITLGLALVDGGAAADVAFRTAGAAVSAAARTLLDQVGHALPDAPMVVFVDEPGLVRLAGGTTPTPEAELTDLLSGVLAVLETRAVTGVHCCGRAPWSIAGDAGSRVLSLPVDCVAAVDPAVIARHLESGGWVAWGAVPTAEPVGGRADRLWRRLERAWAELADGGCDPLLLRRHALVTPACGLAGHGPSQTERALGLCRRIGERVAEVAAAGA